MWHRLFFVVYASIFARCESEIVDVCATKAYKLEAESVLAKLDDSVDPCENFYLFACGNFINATDIPEDKTSYDVSTDLEDRLNKELSEILSKSIESEDIKPIVYSKKLYQACMDEETIEKRGLKPIKSFIKSLGGWPIVEGKNWVENLWSWQKVIQQLELSGLNSNQIFELTIETDLKNSSKRVIYIDQPELGIDREYLIEGFEDEIVKAYYNYHVDSAVLFGAEKFYAEIEAKKVLNFEMELAKILIPKEERRNLTFLYNPMTLKEFQSIFPIHDWYKYINTVMKSFAQVPEEEEIIVTDFNFIVNKVHVLLMKTSNRVIINYLMWRTTSSMTDVLNKELRQRSLEFSKVRSGRQSFEQRWQECVDIVVDSFPISTSALYIRNSFNKESKKIASKIVDSIREEFLHILQSVMWMDENTKAAAIKKAKRMEAHIAYPDELLDESKLIAYYGNLAINDEKYFESMVEIGKFHSKKIYESLRRPVNRSDWESHAAVVEVNAYYNPLENSIQFLAGILQGVFFSANRPQYMNFGGIGSIIGHEITHGFDDEGSQLDADGNLVDWWEEDTKVGFLDKAQCIIDQYNNYTEPTVGMQINGVNTQGENIADNGGIKVAYLAYKKFVSQNGPEPKLPGLNYTSNQLFWISAAQGWCGKNRPEAMKLLINTNTHAPEIFRVNGPFSNMKEFSEDFECSEEAAMNRVEKCEVW